MQLGIKRNFEYLCLPTTFMVAEIMAVWKEGASADTSQLYKPAASSSRLVKATCVALLSDFCDIKENRISTTL